MDSLQSAAQKRETTINQAAEALPHIAPVQKAMHAAPPSGEPNERHYQSEDGSWGRWQSVDDEAGTLPVRPF